MIHPQIIDVIVVVGLVLWLLPLTGHASRLNDVGKWVFILSFAKWLGF